MLSFISSMISSCFILLLAKSKAQKKFYKDVFSRRKLHLKKKKCLDFFNAKKLQDMTIMEYKLQWLVPS